MRVPELIGDNFAGGGGASTGIFQATGRHPDFAINHDAMALAAHAANHPETKHFASNIWQVDPRDATGGRPLGLLWASPDCKHFSKAKGGKPVEKGIRDLAWVVVHWAKLVRPRVIILENVEEFQTWGPLTADHKPDPERKGETFKRWMRELKKLGYKVEWRELVAADYGAPTIRKRLFMIARCDNEPIVWPEPTHFNPKRKVVDCEAEFAKGKKFWRTAAEIIDWSLPCHSIFLSKEEGRAWGVKRPLADATMARIAKGVKRYVLDAKEPFIVNLTHHGSHRNESVEEPFKTVTGAHRGEKALVVPTMIQTGYGEREGQEPRALDLDKPLGTVVAQGVKHAIVQPFVTGVGGRAAQTAPRLLEQPAATGTAKADAVLVAPVITKFRKDNEGSDIAAPMPTITANSYIKRAGGCPPVGLVNAFLAKHYGGHETPGTDLRKPLDTVTAQDHHAIVSAALSSASEKPARPVEVSAGLQSMHGSGRRMTSADQPLSTITAQGLHAAEVRAFFTKYYGNETGGHGIDEPAGTVTVKDRMGLIVIEGEEFQIVDIGMRMLSPRELFSANGFPRDHIIEWGIDIETGDRIAITKTKQVSNCGNSVCPPMAEALVRANFSPREVEWEPSPAPAGEFRLEAAE